MYDIAIIPTRTPMDDCTPHVKNYLTNLENSEWDQEK